MVLKLYGSVQSTCTKRVATILKEKQVPFEFFPINFATGEHKTPEYLKKQPFGQVPYIDDDGFQLFESRAIARYIIKKWASQGTQELIPSDIQTYAKFEQAASIETANFDPPASGLAVEKIFKKFRGQEADETRVAEHIATLNAKLDAYEKLLSTQTYLAGNEITAADLFHLPYGTLAKNLSPESFSSRPHVAKWFETLQQRPSWLAVKDGVA
jgi:glutathione S-transferase